MEAIEKAVRLKAELDALRPLDQEQEARIMQKFRLDWNYHSNHLEGNSLTYGETKALILFGLTAQGKPLQDHFEITGHNEAINMVLEVLNEERPLTENFIREINQLLLKEPHKKPAQTPDGQPTSKTIYPGQYKTQPNHVLTSTGETFYFASPEETPAKMTDLIDWFRENKTSLDPILLAAEFHYKFIRIHPFDDGNGRTARILMNFILMQYGYPPVIIKTEDKANYFAALQQADAGVLDPFIEYIAVNLNRSLEIMINGAKGLNIDEPDDIDKEIALLDQRLRNRKKIVTNKSKKTLLALYDDSITRLTNILVKQGSKLKHHYNAFVVHQSLNDISSLDIRSLISEKAKFIWIQYQYDGFNIGHDAFSYTSMITFEFGVNSYKVYTRTDEKQFIQKYYDEQLSDDEIRKLVDIEVKGHIDYLNLKNKD